MAHLSRGRTTLRRGGGDGGGGKGGGGGEGGGGVGAGGEGGVGGGQRMLWEIEMEISVNERRGN